MNLPLFTSLKTLKETVVECRLCPRLVQYREHVPAKKTFFEEEYWRRPVPGFGDTRARLLLIGLAPSAHGGNRTGRIFTGDDSGRFLFQALYEEGFANQPFSEHCDDGLELKGCYITAAVKCVPPHNKPLPIEFRRCSCYLWGEFALLKEVKTVLALGRGAFEAFFAYAKAHGANVGKQTFQHGGKYPIDGLPTLYASYHPSPQNTNTGKLTYAMFTNVLKQIKTDF
jgi:uracil-DNA glycosylase family 4